MLWGEEKDVGVAGYFATFVCLFLASLEGAQEMLDGSEKIKLQKKKNLLLLLLHVCPFLLLSPP